MTSEWVVVDTDVISYSVKADTRAARYAPHIQNKSIVISFMIVNAVK